MMEEKKPRGGKPPVPVQTKDGLRKWPNMRACALDLGVSPAAVYQAIHKGCKTKGVELRLQ